MNDWKRKLQEEYRQKFGCPNVGKVCWCETCRNIEKLISEIIENIKKDISQ